jgi:pyruvate/2-oxoglutarate dehydrogenase complex dihydrolipoamide dehydrogenase (E3) component
MRSDNVQASPDDEFNRTLVSLVHPPNWENPVPADRYNLVVIGAGTAGLVAAAGAAGLGAKVALVEKHFLGGDCLNYGCVPSKTLIAAARAAAVAGKTNISGVTPGNVTIDFPEIMRRLREVRARIAEHDSAERFALLGIDVFLGEGKFVSPTAINVDGKTLRFSRAVIATGGRPTVPNIEGLEKTGFLTNLSVFDLTELPPRMAFVGAGPIGCELAQAFARLGSEVTILERSRVLPRDDEDAASLIERSLIEDGVSVVCGAAIKKVASTSAGKEILVECQGEKKSIFVDEIFVGTGRAPNVEGIGLEVAGIEYGAQGIVVDDGLRTTNKKVYAAGDVCLEYKFTHAADAAARLVIRNALFFGRAKVSSLIVPWSTYTDPELARVGLSESEAEKPGVEYDCYKRQFADVDRAIAEGEEHGFVKVLTKKGGDKILGATIVAPHAGDMISEITLAMQGGIGLGKISSVIHPYPTHAEAIRHTADLFMRTKLTPRLKKAFAAFLRLRR